MVTFQSIPQTIPIAVAAVLSAVLVACACRRRAMPMAPAFAIMMTGETLWALGAAVEPVVVELPIKRLFIDVRILGTVTAILGLLAFVIRYRGLSKKWTQGGFAIVCGLATVLIAVAWTDPIHHLYFAKLTNVWDGQAFIARRTFGPGFWAMVVYCYALAAVSVVLLADAVLRSSGLYRTQAGVMLFGVLLPWVVEVLDRFGVFPFLPVDLVSPTFLLTGLSLLPALLRLHLLDLPPAAWAKVVDALEDPVVVIDLAGRIAALNPVADRLIGGGAHGLIGVDTAVAFARWPALAERVARLDRRDHVELIALSDQENAPWFDARIAPLGDDAHPSGWVLVLRDLSGIRRAEEARRRLLEEQRARARAEESSRAKDRFLATLGHELRTPLTPILAAVTAMLETGETPGIRRDVLEMISRNVAGEARLIDDLLDLTRIQSGKLRLEMGLVDAHELVREVVETCRADLRTAHVRLVLELGAHAHGLRGDASRLRQVVSNLVRSAGLATPPGGTVTIRTRDGHENGALDARSPDGTRFVLEIKDTGPAIEPEAMIRLFDIFPGDGPWSTRRFGGMGLGLVIGRAIIELHGGRLNAISQGEGRGALFAIDLPSFPLPTIPTHAKKPHAPRAPIRRQFLNILVVDDNLDTLCYLSQLLTARGNVVHSARSLAEALQVARAVDLDLVISDVELADGSGLELMWTIRAASGPPGIAISGFGSDDDIELSQAAGFTEHLTKPIEFKRLEQAIDRVVAYRYTDCT